MNSTIVSTLRRIRLAWRGYGRGPLICAAIMLGAAGVVRFVPLAPHYRRAPEVRGRRAETSTQNAAQRLADLNWVFEPNVGQSDPRAKFVVRTHDGAVFLTDNSVYVSWTDASREPGRNPAGKPDFVKLEFVGAERKARLAGDSQLAGKTNYLLGRNPGDWRVNVPHYGAVRYAGLYPGVDARFYGGAQGFEYDLLAKPGSDPRRIRLRAANASNLQLDGQGNLVMRVGARRLMMKRPEIYQLVSGVRRHILGGYRLWNGNTVGFEVGQYQRNLPLVIDPSISIAYTTFLGGAGAEKGNSVAVDASGKIYVGGTTTLATFPESSTPDGSVNGTTALFAAKIDPSQTGASSLVYLTFIGGSGSEHGGMVALDKSVSPPRLAILGWTTSTNFPVTISSALNGPSDLTVTELNGAGSGPVYSEYFGGSGAEATQNEGGIATDSSGHVFITSDTASSDFPVTAAAIQMTYGGGASDGILAEFAPVTGAMIYSTYFGIDGTVGSSGVAVDASGNAYVAGFTSSQNGFPFVNAFQSSYGGGAFDAFVMEINPPAGATGLIYSSLLGGSGSDQALSIAVDTQAPADAYVTGTTQSPDLIPSTAPTNSPYQSSLNGTSNGFLAVISQPANVPALQYITYLGGNGSDAAQGIAVFSPSQIYVAGTATSANFPALCSLQGFSGTQDAFLAEFNPSVAGASSLLYTTFLAGSVTTEGNAVGSDASGDAFVFGDTLSPDYPLAQHPQSGFQLTCSSCTSTPSTQASSDALLTEVSLTAGLVACPVFSQSPVNVGSFADGTVSPPVNLTMTNDGTANLDINSVTVTGENSSDFSQINTCLQNSPIAPGGNCSISITFTPTAAGKETATLQMADDGVGSPQMLTLNGTGTGTGASVSPTSLTFPSTALGETSNAQTLTLTNIGTDPLQATLPSSPFAGNDPADFKFGFVCNGPILPAGTCNVTVQFAPVEQNPPSGGVALSAQLSILIVDTVNQSTQTITVPVSGTEVPAAPAIVWEPTSLNFGSENVGATTAPQQITLTNNGSAALSISGISITGANAGDFSQTNTCPESLAINGGNCTISVAFQPTATGNRTASISISDNENPSPQTVAISGSGTSAGVNFTPASLTFPGQNVGTPPSQPQTLTLTNGGNAPLTISSITITGVDAHDFLPAGNTNSIPPNNCPIGPNATLSAGSSCPILVTFAPAAAGSRSASLTVADSASPSLQLVTLSGTGTMPGTQFSPTAIDFNALAGTNSSQTVEVQNTGSGPLIITNVGFTGVDAGDFQASGACVGANGASVSVAPASNCAISVVFAPQATGLLSATLSVTDNATGSPQQISATGTATNFQLNAVTGSPTSATVTAGETATFNLQVTPMNGFAGAVALSCSDSMPASSCALAPGSVSVSGSSDGPFTVTVTTTAPAASAYFKPFLMRFRAQPVSALGSLGLLIFALMLLSACKRQDGRRLRAAWLLAGVLLLASCGGTSSNSSSSATPAGTYNLTISGTVPGLTTPRTIGLTVIVQ